MYVSVLRMTNSETDMTNWETDMTNSETDMTSSLEDFFVLHFGDKFSFFFQYKFNTLYSRRAGAEDLWLARSTFKFFYHFIY